MNPPLPGQIGRSSVGSSWDINRSGDLVTVPNEQERLLTPAEVAQLFRVHPKTVSRWVQAGKLSAVRTLGGHRRYRASEVYALLDESGIGAPMDSIAP
ncbi:MAG: hypothetical protein RL134_387 [Actinomycetota bacterium]